MISINQPLGTVFITQEYFTTLIGYAVSSCYGVAGMAAAGKAQGITGLFMQDSLKRGVRVRGENGKLGIELHIIVTYGVNISAIVKSIINKVSYTVEEATGLRVDSVNVFVDGMKTE